MRIKPAFALFEDLQCAVQAAFWPTVMALCQSPSLLFRPAAISRFFMSHVWSAFGNGVDENGREVKDRLIPENAHGVVLELGAGYGHTIQYLNKSRVTKYVAVEPNVHMHDQLRCVAHAAGYTESSGSLLILPYGAEDLASILPALGDLHTVDTIISILTICSIPAPEKTLKALVAEVLKPGGQFLFYEHVLSPRADVAWWQRLWTPLWLLAMDGCRLDRPSHLWVQAVGGWSEENIWGKEGEDEENLFWHRAGKFVKS
ncbi:S-adenosyl-L-methionine-dependent methyltransferase [Hygrophoropsis aurantiaca]|uniref:S-adenosyl-L-methionine-dependent methyltransferase n=1 Tax=Hygrophoropsis aurantiaca TaxID=72124 RepID=A0ACB8ANS2_9AGAM|nr:S-adenosyl-L-methionine-dependent methyltransferase [Hygrophoropsis aurantiaca]